MRGLRGTPSTGTSLRSTVVTRLFVAIWPSTEAVTAATADLDRIRPLHPALRWQAPAWHITIAFLGQAEVERTSTRLDRLLADAPVSSALRLAGAGAFGPVVWLGVEHGEWLTALARRVQRALRTPDQRFRAHVTVARGRGADARPIAAAAVPDLAAHQGPAWVPSRSRSCSR